MVAVVTAVTQQEPVLLVAPSADQAEVEVDLGDQNHRTQREGHACCFEASHIRKMPIIMS